VTITIFSFLLGSVLAGFAITMLSGLALTIEERIFFGAVLGLVVVTAATFGFFLVFGMGPLSIGLGCEFTAGLGTVGFLAGRARLATELSEFKDRWSSHLLGGDCPWPLWLLLLICWTYTLHFFSQVYVFDAEGLHAGYTNIWGDWGAHLSYAGSFAYGDNRPPEFFIDPGNRLGYAFAIDFLAAMLVPLGATLTNSLVITSVVLALAFPGVMYCAGLRLVKSRVAAALAVLIFAMMGGLGFIYFLADLDKQGMAALATPPQEYTLNRDLGYQWLDPVLAYLVPQRSVLFGFSLLLISVTLLWIIREVPASEDPGRRHKIIRPLVFTGAVVGVMPVCHPYAYGTAIALAVIWALTERAGTGTWWLASLRGLRSQLPFLIPALAFGLPALLWLLPAGGAHSLRVLPGWMAFISPQGRGFPDVPLPEVPGRFWGWLLAGLPGLTLAHALHWLWFWIKNLSLFLPLLVIAQLWRGVVPDRFRVRFLPLWLWFVIPNFFVFQPWEWDNTKFFIFWALFGSMLVAALVVRIAAAGVPGQVLACACAVLLVLAGGIDLYRASNYSISSRDLLFTDAGGVRLADWVRANTDAHAVFLTAHEPNHPVPALAGRRVVLGNPIWLSTYQVADYATKEADVERMLRGDPQTPELLRRYQVDYVVIGPLERGDRYKANANYWRANAHLVHDDGGYLVFKVDRNHFPGWPSPQTDVKSMAQAVPGSRLGGFRGDHDLSHRCGVLGYRQASFVSGTWECQGKADGSSDNPVAGSLDLNAACQWAYGTAATARQEDPSDKYSWVCVRAE
jgi:hypothetical protein